MTRLFILRDRMKRKGLSVHLLLLASGISCIRKGEADTVNPPLECEMYMAESTIPFAGLGIFTTVEKKIGDTVGNGDVCFPLMELDWHNGLTLEEVDEYYNPFEDYVWDGVTMGMGSECDSEVTALWPGLDCAINCHIPLENVKRSFPLHASHGDEGLDYIPHRRKDPGAGSISTYRSSKTMVIRDIPAGGELFKFYGDTWFLTRDDLFDGLPLQRDFPKTQALLEEYDRIGFQPLYNLLLEVQATWGNSRTLNALPQNEEDLALSLEKNVTHMYQANATRSLEWLQENGKCVDHIVHKASTIPGAGEGAFAKRHLPKDTLITGSPLMHIPDPTLLDMYDFEYDEETEEWSQEPLNTTQVVLNYCFGHRDTALLLFPYGSGVNYINHASGDKANVRLQWAEHGTTSHDSVWLERQLLEDWEIHLAIDYYAIRDIEEGEELFLDYGSEWEEAWNAHVANWKPPAEITTAADWNMQFGDAPVLTLDEWVDSPYPPTIQVRCHVDLIDEDWDKKEQRWERYVPHTEEYQQIYGLPCEVVERSEDDISYVVNLQVDRLVFRGDLPDDFDDVRTGVPREAIFFMDAPYESDLYIENAFRHPIVLPDDLMPEAWKEKTSTQDEGPGNDEL